MMDCYLRCWCCERPKITQLVVKYSIGHRKSWKLSHCVRVFRLTVLLSLELIFLYHPYFYTETESCDDTSIPIVVLGVFAFVATCIELGQNFLIGDNDPDRQLKLYICVFLVFYFILFYFFCY